MKTPVDIETALESLANPDTIVLVKDYPIEVYNTVHAIILALQCYGAAILCLTFLMVLVYTSCKK